MQEHQSLTLVPTEFLERMEAEISALREQIEGATIIPTPVWVPIKEAAEHFGKNRSTIHRWIEQGILEARGAHGARQVRIERG